jgi:hypothetical protein
VLGSRRWNDSIYWEAKMSHPTHPRCPGCSKSLFKAFEKGKAVKPTDPWDFCRNVTGECRFAGPEGIANISKAMAKDEPVEGDVEGKSEDGFLPVRSSAIGRLIGKTDFKIVYDGEGVPHAELEKPKSVPEREVFFWNSGKSRLSNHVTKFTPTWCDKHQFAYSGTSCPAKHKAKKPPEPPSESPAVAAARKKLEPLVKMLAPSDSPPAAVGLVMALLNQQTGNKSAANLLIDEYKLDKLFGLQKF